MVDFAHDFETGVEEAAVVGTEPTGGANDATDIDVGAELVFDPAKSGARRGMAARFATGATSATARWEWGPREPITSYHGVSAAELFPVRFGADQSRRPN